METLEVTHTASVLKCCQCGMVMEANEANMCINCIRGTINIAHGIPSVDELFQCKKCLRWQQPPNQWIFAELESRELLALGLKKLKGLSKVKLINASFIWTEPHSRRVKLQLVVQKEVFTGTLLELRHEVEFVVRSRMCPACHRVMAENTWSAVVQVRQRVPHKRTFLLLEQLIIKFRAHNDVLNIKEHMDGLDFYFASRGHAINFTSFLQSALPVKCKTSEKLVSHDSKSNKSEYKHTTSVLVAPICKGDLAVLPIKVANKMGGLFPLLLCTRVSSCIHLIDIKTLKPVEISGSAYWKDEFTALFTRAALTEYVVLDVEYVRGTPEDAFIVADCEVARSSDLGTNDVTIRTTTHLGHILHAGDTVLGYDLTNASVNNAVFDKLTEKGELPDVVLVRKTYPARRSKARARKFKLASLTIEPDESRAYDEGDKEIFLRELEEDPTARENVLLFRNQNVEGVVDNGADDEDESEEDDFPGIPDEELVDVEPEEDDESFDGVIPTSGEGEGDSDLWI